MIDTRAIPLIDAHHHFWDPERNRIPWLTDPLPIPFRYGDYAPLRRPYMPPDLFRDAADFDLRKSVYIETEWDPTDPLGEIAWVKSVREEYGFPHAATGQAWLDRDGVEEVLAGHAEVGFVRGVRHKPAVAHAPHAPPPGPRGSMSDEKWREGYALLERYGLFFELQTVWWHLPEAARLARDFPGTLIVLDHAGVPTDRSEAGLDAWARAMRAIAAQPNVVVKISGLGVRGAPWTPALNRLVVLDTIDAFGVERCMFGSNFPVDGLTGSYRTIMGGFMELVADRPEADRRKLFHDNAARVYINRDRAGAAPPARNAP